MWKEEHEKQAVYIWHRDEEWRAVIDVSFLVAFTDTFSCFQTMNF